MQLSRSSIGVILVLLIALVVSLTTQTIAVAPSSATTVAVIDVVKLYEELQERLDLEADQRQKRERLEQERQERLAEINSLQQDLQIAPEGTSVWETKQNELLEKTAQYQAWFQVQQQRLQRETAVRLQGIEKKMNDAISQTARDHGIDLVVNRHSDIPIGGNAQQQQQQQKFNLRMVLYATDTLDITNDVAQRMNNEFRNQ